MYSYLYEKEQLVCQGLAGNFLDLCPTKPSGGVDFLSLNRGLIKVVSASSGEAVEGFGDMFLCSHIFGRIRTVLPSHRMP